MPLKEDVLQQQLQTAQSELGKIEGTLAKGATPKKNPIWRRANAAVNQIQERLSSRQTAVSGGAKKKDASGDEGEGSEES